MEHCYRVRLAIEAPRTYVYEGYLCVPLGDEENIESRIMKGEGFDWEIKRDIYLSCRELTNNLDIVPFTYEILYDTNEDEVEDA